VERYQKMIYLIVILLLILFWINVFLQIERR
jgi:hypothetical protein